MGLWAGTFIEMWHRWFPAWEMTDQPLRQRLLGGDSYFAHGLWAVVAAVFLAWREARRSRTADIAAVAPTARLPRLAGWLLLLIALAVHSLSRWAGVTFMSAYALIAALAGIALAIGGIRELKRYGWALAVAALAVPLPMAWIAQLNLTLKQIAIDGAMGLAQPWVRGGSVRHGSYVLIAAQTATGAESHGALLIGSVCSGLRSLVALLFTATLFAALCRLRGWRCVVLLLTALPLAVALNVLRVAVLIAGAGRWGVDVASEGGWLHDWTGPALFLIALMILTLIERAMAAVRRPADVAPASAPPDAHRPASQLEPWVVVTVLALSMLVSMNLSGGVSAVRSDAPTSAAPLLMPGVALNLDGRWVVGRPLPIDQATRRWLASGRWSYQRFGAPDVDALLIETGGRRDMLHPPEVCLGGRGDALIERSEQLTTEGTAVTELLVAHAGVRVLYRYVYACAGRTTPHFTVQHARMAARALRGQAMAGRLIRVSTPLAPADAPTQAADMDVARRRLDEVLTGVMRALDDRQPPGARLARP